MLTHITQQGNAAVEKDNTNYHLILSPADDGYHNAQISSYAVRSELNLSPPVRLSLRAQFAGATPPGTAGFGFWNHPFAPGERGLRLPRAAWFFFGSPANNMALALNKPGYGWKAGTFDAANWRFLTLLPTAPMGFLLMRIPWLYRRLWPIGQRALGISEMHIDATMMTTSHAYQIDWLSDRVRFYIDGQIIHEAPLSPRGPLGFVAWTDNQYAVVTPQGRLGFGMVKIPAESSLLISELKLEITS